MTQSNPNRPAQRLQFRNIGIGDLIHYRLPLPGIVSILHRLSGVALFLFLPLLLRLFDLSLSSEASFGRFASFVHGWEGRLLLLGLGWALLHHVCAGVRFLLLDLHLGLAREAARRSSIAVFAVSLPLALLLAAYLFGAF